MIIRFKNIFLVHILVLFSCSAMAQDNVARLTLLIGSHIEFNFNSIADYQNGKQITNGSTIGVTMSEILPAVLSGWHIDVQTFLGATDFTDNSGGGVLLPSETIQIEATDASGNLGTAIFTGLQDLTAGGATLMSTNDLAHVPANPNTHQINLSYECGMNGLGTNNLLGTAGGYYTIEVEVILIPDF